MLNLTLGNTMNELSYMAIFFTLTNTTPRSLLSCMAMFISGVPQGIRDSGGSFFCPGGKQCTKDF